jgi:hypothetical protein
MDIAYGLFIKCFIRLLKPYAWSTAHHRAGVIRAYIPLVLGMQHLHIARQRYAIFNCEDFCHDAHGNFWRRLLPM